MPGMPKLRGIGASRVGRPSISLQTLIDRVPGNVRRKKLAAAAPSVEDAEQAAQVLQRSRGRMSRYRDAMLAGGALRPIVRGVSNAVESAVAAPKGQRWRAALRGTVDASTGKDVKGFSAVFRKPQLARDVVEGGLGGAVVNAGREGLELGRARRTAQAFLRDDDARTPVQQKLAAGLKKSLNHLSARIQPVPTSKLAPIIDSDIDYEI